MLNYLDALSLRGWGPVSDNPATSGNASMRRYVARNEVQPPVETGQRRITRGLLPRSYGVTCTDSTVDRSDGTGCTGISRRAVPRPVPRTARGRRWPSQEQLSARRPRPGRPHRAVWRAQCPPGIKVRRSWLLGLARVRSCRQVRAPRRSATRTGTGTCHGRPSRPARTAPRPRRAVVTATSGCLRGTRTSSQAPSSEMAPRAGT